MYKGVYTLIGQEPSMFTRKLEAQLRYQDIPYEWKYKSQEDSPAIEARAGTRFIPVLGTPDGWMINDTISVGPFLHQRFSLMPVIPDTPAQRGACFVLEDFFNHWYPRHALHSRWCYPDNVAVVGPRFGMNLLFGKSYEGDVSDSERAQVADMGQFMYDAFGKAACEVQGAGPDKKSAIQNDFGRLLSLLSTHLGQHSFLLGERACLADFALVGPFKAHFLVDPEPRRWCGEHVATMEDYVERVWRAATPGAQWPADDVIPATVYPLFDYARQHYQVFAATSIAAAGQGEKTFDLDLGDGTFTARSMKRLEKARLHVQDELLICGAEKSALQSTGVMDYYLAPSAPG